MVQFLGHISAKVQNQHLFLLS